MTAEPFELFDCTLSAISTGKRVQNLRELRDVLSEVHPGSINYHFWGRFLRPSFDEPEFNNDFAAWAYHGLHDLVLAEKLAMVDPTDHPSIEDLRRELVEIIEERLDEREFVPWAPSDKQFYFVRSQLFVIETGKRFASLKELAEFIPAISPGSIYYHFIEGRRRPPLKVDDFCAWLSKFGQEHKMLTDHLTEVGIYFTTLSAIRARVIELFQSLGK